MSMFMTEKRQFMKATERRNACTMIGIWAFKAALSINHEKKVGFENQQKPKYGKRTMEIQLKYMWVV